MVVLVLDRRVEGGLYEVVRLERDHVREGVAPGEREVSNNEVERLVRVLDAQGGDVVSLAREASVSRLLMLSSPNENSPCPRA